MAKWILPLLVLLFAAPSVLPQEANVQVFGQSALVTDPSPMHAAIYRMMEGCTGQQGDYETLRWGLAEFIIEPSLTRVLGFWNREHRTIIIDKDYAYHAGIISHEILHDLFNGQTSGDVYEQCIIRGTGGWSDR